MVTNKKCNIVFQIKYLPTYSFSLKKSSHTKIYCSKDYVVVDLKNIQIMDTKNTHIYKNHLSIAVELFYVMIKPKHLAWEIVT